MNDDTQREIELAVQSEYNQMFNDQISDLEARIESLEKYVSELRRSVDNIHPIVYNIINKESPDEEEK